MHQWSLALVGKRSKPEAFPEIQIQSEFLHGCVSSLSSYSSVSLSPPPSFATPAVCKLGLNGCGDDALCLHALWVMSGSPCIAVNMESECCRVNEAITGRIWKKICVIQYHSRLCEYIRWHKTVGGCVIYLFFYDHVWWRRVQACKDMESVLTMRFLDVSAVLCCPLQAWEKHWRNRWAQLQQSDIIVCHSHSHSLLRLINSVSYILLNHIKAEYYFRCRFTFRASVCCKFYWPSS